MRALPLLLVSAVLCFGTARAAQPVRDHRVRVEGGELKRASVAPGQPDAVAVAAFWLDATPVTQGAFQAFVQQNPQWRRDRAPKLFVDDAYLEGWAGPGSHGNGVLKDAPVTQVSWFAARAYCEWRGGRLPTTDEWEWALSVPGGGFDKAPSPEQAAQTAAILAWYAAPTVKRLPAVGQGSANARGVHDLIGLVWEWTEDYDSAFVTSDARQGKDNSAVTYCGGAAVDAKNPSDYASFMRVAFRSSLQSRYALPVLGFRCAYDLPKRGTPP